MADVHVQTTSGQATFKAQIADPTIHFQAAILEIFFCDIILEYNFPVKNEVPWDYFVGTIYMDAHKIILVY